MNSRDAIIATVAAWCGPDANPAPLLSIASRESNFNADAIGDVEIAKRVFERVQPKLLESRHPFANVPERWAGSFGLFQMMAPYHAQGWSKNADPHLLFDPHIATVVAGRLWNRAIALGARTPMDVRMVWAFGPDGLKIPKSDERYTSRLSKERARLQSLGFDADLATAPATSMGYSGFGQLPQPGQDGKLRRAKGQGQSQDQTPGASGGGLAKSLMFVAIIAGGIAWMTSRAA